MQRFLAVVIGVLMSWFTTPSFAIMHHNRHGARVTMLNKGPATKKQEDSVASADSNMAKKLTDENEELKTQNEELERENSLLKAKISNLEAKHTKAKGDTQLMHQADHLKDLHHRAEALTCEQQVRDLTEALVEHGDTSSAKQIKDRANFALKDTLRKVVSEL